MRKTILRCASCEASLSPPERVGAVALPCPVCRQVSRAWVFPAMFQERDSTAGQRLLDEGQSSCMNHPQKQAVTVCDSCGKFLCALCDVEWNDEHLCTTCIQHRKQSDHAGAYRTSYTHYDSVALIIVLLSLAFMPFFGLGGFLAPVTFYVAWRYWRVPWRPVPHGKWYMVLAILLANFVILIWLVTAVYFMRNAL